MFGTRAESLSRYLSKGAKVVVEGKLRWSQWERDGQKRSKIEVIVDELEFMSSRRSEEKKEEANLLDTPQDSVVNTEASVYDEDIPF